MNRSVGCLSAVLLLNPIRRRLHPLYHRRLFHILLTSATMYRLSRNILLHNNLRRRTDPTIPITPKRNPQLFLLPIQHPSSMVIRANHLNNPKPRRISSTPLLLSTVCDPIPCLSPSTSNKNRSPIGVTTTCLLLANKEATILTT